jgi:hypothetical protein
VSTLCWAREGGQRAGGGWFVSPSPPPPPPNLGDHKGFEGNDPPKKSILYCVCFLVVFQHMVFFDGFIILVKELGLLTYPGKCIGVFWILQDHIYCILL